MKNNLLFILFVTVLMIFPKISFAQPNLGTAADFVLFTTNGAVTNTGITHLTGHVGSNVGGSTGFGNVDGVMHDQDPASAAATADLNVAYLQLDAAVATFFPGILLGNGQTLNAGVYSIGAAATMNGELNLDGQGDPNALFIIQIEGTFATNANAKVNLLNGAIACNIFWKIEGQLSLATGTTMKGTLVANNSAISIGAGVQLEGRALSINGGIGVDAMLGHTPLGCLTPILTGPPNQALGTTECFVIFSGIGDVTNVGVTTVTGDVGTNSGTTIGFNPLLVTGDIHPVPDGATAQCATDFTSIYNDLVALPYDIELLYPNQLGNSLVLTPHVYLMNSAVTFTDTLFLNAQGNPDAVFVFQVYGAFGTSTYSNVVLTNGAQAKNVYWLINGALDVNDYSTFSGTIISQGAINLMTGVTLYGRALTGVGAVSTSAIDAIMPTSCAPFTVTEPMDTTVCDGSSASFTITATGINLTYQWRKGNVDLINGGNISGATTATLTINPATLADQAIDYNVIVSGSFNPSDTSNFASLTIDEAPVITLQPLDQTVCEGDSVGFSVVATGLNLTYQWRKGLVNLVNGGSISGATTSTLSINPVSVLDAAIDYNVVVTGTCLPDAISNDVSLTIDELPIITLQPMDQIACEGNPANFTVVASGSNLTYQWRKGLVDLIDGGSISGATTATLTINPTTLADAATDYNVVITGACLPSVISNDAILTIGTLPVITSQPADEIACTGNAVSFSVVASGQGLTYQWRKGLVNLIDGGSISGATTSILTINPVSLLDAAIDYNVVVTSACSPSAISNNVSLTVDPCEVDLSISKTASDLEPFIGSTLVFTVTASNLGAQNATGVEVSEQLQSGYSYVSSTVTAGSYDPVTGIWTIGNMNGATTETLTITVTVLDAGVYLNAVTVYGNDPESDLSNNQISIAPEPIDFHIPEGFSPNDDLINDLFIIRGIARFPSNHFTVFNRWGNVVFEAEPYTNTWDGTSESNLNIGGDELPVGTYFYVLDLGDGSDIYKGTIYLNK